MTRINVVPPEELCNAHLLAEWRELTRIPNGIISGKFKIDLNQTPKHYTVRTNDNPDGGKGHMKFFFNKLKYLYNRYSLILNELSQRGIPQKNMWPYGPGGMFPDFHFKYIYNDYEPTLEALSLNRKRIQERLPLNPKYRL